jgi:DNA-binding CsgD family transcriptional regulator
MSIVFSPNGFLLLDSALNVVAANQHALQILCFPSDPQRIKQPTTYIADRVRTNFGKPRLDKSGFLKEIKSGRRRYLCKSFHLDYGDVKSGQNMFAVLMERDSGGRVLGEFSDRFDLTGRERETVDYLLQGLTSKEIAVRMNISPNTVKAFLRLVMVKMKVSTRSGIAGRIAGSRSDALSLSHQ